MCVPIINLVGRYLIDYWVSFCVKDFPLFQDGGEDAIVVVVKLLL